MHLRIAMRTSAERSITTDSGFILIEALVGLLLVSAVAAGTGHLLVVTLSSTRDARDDGSATALAVQRLEQLISAVDGGAPLTASPDNALETDTPGFSDRVDTGARAVTAGAAESTVFVRRWRLKPAVAPGSGAWVLQVRVLTVPAAVSPGSLPNAGARRPGDVVLTTIRRMP